MASLSEPGSRPAAAGIDSRLAAVNLLDAVLRKGAALDEALRTSRALARLAPRDRAFARLLLATVLRRMGQIDAALGAMLDRKLPPAMSRIEAVLRLGAAQLLALDGKPHAVVDSAVRVADRIGAARSKGLINAVLRRIAAEGPALYAAQDATRLNTPDWLWESWVAAYGESATRAMAEIHLAEPPLDLAVKQDAVGWAEKLRGTALNDSTVRLARPAAVTGLAGFREGAWWVQDIAAGLPARLLLSALDGGAGRGIVDLCAAPGGKTAQLAAAGARVTAVDRSAERLRLLRENLERLSLPAAVVEADAMRWRPDTPPDGILLDAPCTGTGTLRRHPDIARNKGPADVTRLAAIQQGLIENAARALRPGGVLVYSVCSLQPEEGPRVVARLLAARPELRRLPIARGETGLPADAVTERGDLRTLPCHLAEAGGMDGFYAARLARPGPHAGTARR